MSSLRRRSVLRGRSFLRSYIGISVWRVVIFGVLDVAVPLGFAIQDSAEMAILVDGSVLRTFRNHSKRVVWCKFC